MNVNIEKIKNMQAEAATFRRLIAHLQKRTDVQNIDLMNVGGFCRNCLAKWYVESMQEQQIHCTYEEARTYIYAMEYEHWKNTFQK